MAVMPPPDILAIVEKLFEPYSYLADGPNEADVARLILAERQRCAKEVLALVPEFQRLLAQSDDQTMRTVLTEKILALEGAALRIEEGTKP